MSNLKLPSMTAFDLAKIVKTDREKTIAYETTAERYWNDAQAEYGYFIRHHGNMIAHITPDYIELSNAGWDSRTTAMRLNRICIDNNMPFRVAMRQNDTQLYRKVHNMDRLASFSYQTWFGFRRTESSWSCVR